MIETRNLNYGYNKSQNVLKDINLQMPEGHIYGILGKNGVGKSTLLKILSGSLLTKGDYTIDGVSPRLRKSSLQEKIRLVPENEAIPNCKIEELGPIMQNLYPTFDKGIFEQAMTELEVPRQHNLTHMSLGQQKKALIALSLACNTPYLFMDEPTNGMDIPSKSSFRRLIASVANESKTVLISTHQVDDLNGLIDYIIILENNGVLLSAPISEIGTRLCFGPKENGMEVIYSEPSLRGEWCITENKTGEEMPVDTKLLFTAVVKHPETFMQIFSQSR